jgi:hypothetical protein
MGVGETSIRVQAGLEVLISVKVEAGHRGTLEPRTLEARIMKACLLLLLVCLLAGCAAGPLVLTERDPQADFRRQRAYVWMQQPTMQNPMLQQRVVVAINAALADYGWHEAPESRAEVLLVSYVASREEPALHFTSASTGIQRIELRTYNFGMLVVYLFDARSKKAIWRGIAQGIVPNSEARRDRDAALAVRRMFHDFPAPHADPGTQ